MSTISRKQQNEKNSIGCFSQALACILITLVMLTGYCCSSVAAEIEQKGEKSNYAYYGGDYYGIDQAAKSVFYVEIYDSNNKGIGTASGFVMFDEHLFVTNQHVIDGAANLLVMDDDGEVYVINQVIVSDAEHDIAILLFPDGDKYHPLEYDTAFDELKRGQPVLAIGSPKGFFGTVSDGIISAFLKFRNQDIRYIQITAPISHGSSGGCLLNEDLKVIGITSGGQEEGENIGWAIPVFIADQLYSQWNKADTLPLGTEESWDTVGHGLHSRISGTADRPKSPDPTAGSSGNSAQTPADSSEPQQTMDNPDHLVQLGDMYYWGDGVEQSYEKAAGYYMLAADQGSAAAMGNLGFMYENGLGVPLSYDKAREYYEKAADLGDALSLYNLGYMYLYGLGVPLSYDKALQYYEKAADMGDAAALNNLGYMYQTGQGVPVSYDKAREYYEKAADLGLSTALSNLGYMYQNGLGVAVSYDRALEYYEKAADLGNAMALNNLGSMYQNGLGVAVSYDKALEYYEKAAAQGNAMALYRLGDMYYFGDGVAQSYDKAREYYEKAADLGNAMALYSLGNMYFSGDGVTQSYDKAMEYYEKAAALGNEAAQNAIDRIKAK